MRAFLEGTEALAPNAQAAFLLSDKALARVRRDLMSGRLLKDSWAGPKTQEPWKSLINDFNVRALPERITKDLHKGRFVTLKEGQEVVDIEAEEQDDDTDDHDHEVDDQDEADDEDDDVDDQDEAEDK
ncbi:hypothetical protein PC110_g21428 [Phytophthora cactorum]|uniref:Uncharacterized protein n=1 Tax=Phytophthora cactorum TaxID=29920 RepID=A0A329RCF8_9STRA|nr:hypothetical protein PC110_g21428 [Phytophthora cactorum]